MEISHAHFTEVTGMVFIEIGSVMVLSTGHTTSTGMLAMLAYTTVTSGHMATAGSGWKTLARRNVQRSSWGASREGRLTAFVSCSIAWALWRLIDVDAGVDGG